MKRFAVALLPVLALGALYACSSDTPEPLTSPDASFVYKATVRRTTAGVPHVKADSLGSVAYGYGYVFAEDDLCILAEEIMTVRGERAKYLGDLPYDLGNTQSQSNVSSDAFYKTQLGPDVVARWKQETPPEAQAMVKGFAAGVSRYVRELKEGKHEGRHLACRDAGWVREISEDDLYLRFSKLTLLASAATFIDGIRAAQPGNTEIVGPKPPPPPGPAPVSPPAPAAIEEGLQRVAPKLVAQRTGEMGSNMYAFGADVTGGGGLQLGNPHFPWAGGERLYQVHLTVPGVMDVQGASLYGVPLVLIGFNEKVAWSHTVSTAYRFTPYALTLKEGNPYTYVKDDVEKPITPVDVAVEVKQADGSIGTESVRLWRSEYGPMVYLGNSVFVWSAERAYTIRDANAENFRLIRHYFRWNTAKSLDEFERIQAEEVAVPWVNTTATDKNGDAYFADVTVVPAVTNELADACQIPLLSQALRTAAPGLALLDGSKASCDWEVFPDAPQPGIFPASKLPKTRRRDYVVNCNDSHWLTNPNAPITGYPRIVGREAYEQSWRTRLCHQQVLDRLSNADGLGAGVTGDQIERIVVSGRTHTAELFRDEAVAAFCGAPTLSLTRDPAASSDEPAPVDVQVQGAPCDSLKAWDRHASPDSRGSLLWDAFWRRVEIVRKSTPAFDVVFDPADPIHTPRGLKVAEPKLAQAFAAAVREVQASGFAFDAPRSELTYRLLEGGEKIPVPGGYQFTGNFTIAQADTSVLKPGTGYGPSTVGNSYMQVVTMKPEGVSAKTFVTYSQSVDPASPHYADYTRLYAQKQWVTAAFTEAEIAADTKSTLDLAE